MNASKILAAAALSLLAAAGAHAETYEGVQSVNSGGGQERESSGSEDLRGIHFNLLMGWLVR